MAGVRGDDEPRKRSLFWLRKQQPAKKILAPDRIRIRIWYHTGMKNVLACVSDSSELARN